MLQHVEMQFVFLSAKHQSACLVVGSDHNERFVGVLPVELVCHTHRIVHVNHLLHHAHIVGMASPVYPAPLHHQEEAILCLLPGGEMLHSRLRDLSQREVALCPIHGIGYATAVFAVGFPALQQYHLGRRVFHLLPFVPSMGNGVTAALCQLVECGLVFVFLWCGVLHISPCKEVVTAGSQLGAYGIVIVSAGHMGIEGGRGGMVQGDAGGNAHGCPCLLRLVGNAMYLCGFVAEQSQHAIGGFMTCGKCRATRSRVGDALTGTLSVDQRHIGE